jgi:hypothetical protein
MGRRISRIVLLTALVAVLIATPAGAALFVGPTYGGEAFSDSAGPFGWAFQSSHSTGEFAGVEYRLSTEASWHRCLEPRAFNGHANERVPAKVALSSLPTGVYGIEIANDLSIGWLGENGTINSSLNTCGDVAAPPTQPISSDSFSVASPGAEKPASPPTAPSPPSSNASPPNTTQQPNVPTGTSPALVGTAQPKCVGGSIAARIGGHSYCLHAGQQCSYHQRHQYLRYHLACVRRGRHYKLIRH